MKLIEILMLLQIHENLRVNPIAYDTSQKIRCLSTLTKPSLTPSFKVFKMLENRKKNRGSIDSTKLLLK